VLVQWMHAYEIGDRLLAQVLCTLRQVFPHVAVFLIADGDLAFAASAAPLQFDAGKYEAAVRDPAVTALARRGLPHTLAEWQATQLAGADTVADVCAMGLPPLQERFPQLEYQAPRDFFAGHEPKMLLQALDERLRPGPAAAPDDRRQLGRFLRQRAIDQERPMLAALGEAHPEAELLAVLPDAATATSADKRAWCSWFSHSLTWVLEHPVTRWGPVHPQAPGWARTCRREAPP
jgi:hypothetical protein